MATQWTKFNLFVDALCKAQINLSTATVKVLLSNAAPPITAAKYSDIQAAELANGNGYTTGGIAVPGLALSNANGVETLADSQTVVTASTGNLGPFRYVTFYDSTSNVLIGFYDYGQSVTLNGLAGETFTIQSGGSLLTVS